MANEFHTLNGVCTSLVPQGPSYANVTIANQVCTTVGSVAGETFVSGSRFISLSFGYTYSHLWRVSYPLYLLLSFLWLTFIFRTLESSLPSSWGSLEPFSFSQN